jgi:methyltransferase (TIGR00027 family)
MSAFIYYLIFILLFPVTLLGYIIWVGKGILLGRGSGVSGTAQGPLSARWFQHQLGQRLDPAADKLLRTLPGIPPLGLKLVGGPMQLAHRASGYVPKTFRYPYTGDVPPMDQASARVAFFDGVVEREVLHDPARSTQFVILGAGFDTRAYALPPDLRAQTFEVDTPQTQAVKRAALQSAGIDAEGISYVSADFEHEDWLAKLTAAGFDPSRRALFLIEGVLVYLEREAVEDTLRKIASTARGSVVAFDYFTTDPLTSNGSYWRYARWATNQAHEPLVFGIDATPPVRERLEEFLHSCGLILREQRTLGTESATERAWGGFATAIVG